jgi:hypothetical protein
MVYAFSNAGLDVNVQNSKGNTALHLAFQRGYTELGFLFIEVNILIIYKVLVMSFKSDSYIKPFFCLRLYLK